LRQLVAAQGIRGRKKLSPDAAFCREKIREEISKKVSTGTDFFFLFNKGLTAEKGQSRY